MTPEKTSIENVDQYISTFPQSTQALLQQMRATIREAAPQAEEVISYQMPAFRFHGVLVYFAGYKNHIGFYPTPSGIQKFKQELSVFKNSKGAVQFPLSKPLPIELIKRIVSFRVQENLEKVRLKSAKKKS
jgi:uncharacterized protein YdhG (YjbR/CyaY superfamily)